ncbi:PREDICTED: uncharacterized protein LOC106814152 [Priapulus caudatus]|uniref:Uncharacterized protein LOC106814152 n=1 Tax=Priapulus caudatus TaxID=37621 RepID=A0ABM1EP10_PRICU|nr:PREDICTED: uncharacterized protein LOC106814152 [Priapulus caudatus]
MQDLGLPTGTYVNNCRVENSRLQLVAGDVIRFGDCGDRFRFLTNSESLSSRRISDHQPARFLVEGCTGDEERLPQLGRSVVTSSLPSAHSLVTIPHPRPATANTTMISSRSDISSATFTVQPPSLDRGDGSVSARDGSRRLRARRPRTEPPARKTALSLLQHELPDLRRHLLGDRGNMRAACCADATRRISLIEGELLLLASDISRAGSDQVLSRV